MARMQLRSRNASGGDGMFGLGASEAEEYNERARRYYNTYLNLVTRIGRIASKEERTRLMALVGDPKASGTLAYRASSVDDDIRMADQWTPPNTLVWAESRRRGRVDELKEGVKSLETAVVEAENRVGILPPESQEPTIREVVRTVIIEKPPQNIPVPLPPVPPVPSSTGPQDKKDVPTGVPPGTRGAALIPPGKYTIPLVIGGVAALGAAVFFFFRKK